MQLYAPLATASRPVFIDRCGFLYLATQCPECKGEGEMSYSTLGLAHPSSRSETCACATCNGAGKVYEETCEDELSSN